jgi:hypothetical protein
MKLKVLLRWTLLVLAAIATASCMTSKAREFGDPVLARIANTTPDYSEDFSDPSSGWPDNAPGTQPPSLGYVDGEYSVTSPSNFCCVQDSRHPELVYSDFVLEVDGRFAKGQWGGWEIQLIQKPTVDQPNRVAYFIGFYPDGTFYVSHFDAALTPQEKYVTGSSNPGAAGYKRGRGFNHLTIVSLGKEMAFYMNHNPIWFLEKEPSLQRPMVINFRVRSEGSDALEAHYDNLQVWDLSSQK